MRRTKGQMYNSSGRARARVEEEEEKYKQRYFFFTSKRDDVIELRSRNTHQPDARIGPSGHLTMTA
jgi:hypothetical protein